MAEQHDRLRVWAQGTLAAARLGASASILYHRPAACLARAARDGGDGVRRMVAGMVLAAGSMAASSAQAAPLGATGIIQIPDGAPYDLSSQTSLSEVERQRWMGLFGRYADLCVALGLGTVRVGSQPPEVFSWGAVEPQPNTYRFLIADLLVETLVARGLDPVLPLSSRAAWDHDEATMLPQDKARFRDYVRLLVERYDGDLDFGVPPGEEYPDVTGDGSVSIADWGASEADRQAWASAHVVRWWEVVADGPAEQVAPLVLLVQPEARLASDEARLLVAGNTAGAGGKAQLQARLGGLDPKRVGERLVDAVGFDVPGTGDGLGAAAIFEELRDTFGWVAGVGLGDAQVWLTSVGAGAVVPGEGVTGPCGDPRCDERTQAAQLTKLLVQALETSPVAVPTGFEERRFDRVLLREPVEHGESATWRGGGLLTLAEGDPATDPLLVRPAWAAVARLAPVLNDAAPDGVRRLVLFPDNEARRIYRVRSTAGETRVVAWYNWDMDLGATPYDGRFLKVSIDALAGDAALVSTLYPDSIDQVTGGADVSWSLPEQLVPLESGSLTIDIRDDALLVEPTSTTGPAEDAGSVGQADTVVTEADAGPVQDTAPPAAPAAEGGCGATGSAPAGASLLALLLALGVARRRGADQKR